MLTQSQTNRSQTPYYDLQEELAFAVRVAQEAGTIVNTFYVGALYSTSEAPT